MKAFPNGIITDDKGVIVSSQQGMDLRDYFAAKVLPKMIDGGFSPSNAATYSYEFADAMMKAREL